MKDLVLLAGLLVTSLVTAGCVADGTGGGSGSSTPTAPPPPRPTPPSIDTIDVPDYPPLGPHGQVAVRVRDDLALASLSATFRSTTFKPLQGKDGTVSFTGRDLGEGMGTLSLVACDTQSACVRRMVSNLLVDMTPPEIDVERVVASPNADGLERQISFWVADAWVLGSVELAYKGKVLTHEFPKAYPSTLGSRWDVSRVAFDAKDLPAGSGTAVLTAKDAAGNATTKQVAIRIDGSPPTLAILEPAPLTAVSGSVTVRVSSTDPEAPGAPTRIEVFVGGAPVVELPGPVAAVDVDTSALPKGPTEIRAVARDEAGNRSPAASVVVDVQ